MQLTINSKAQQAAYAALKEIGKSGAVVALNPKTGAILALASYPSFDPNEYATFNGAKLNKIDAKYRKPTRASRCSTGPSTSTYPPGSTFKIVTSSTAFGTGRYNPNTSVHAPTSLSFPRQQQHAGQRRRRVLRRAARSTLIFAFTLSCNTAFGHLGDRLGSAGAQAAGRTSSASTAPTWPSRCRFRRATSRWSAGHGVHRLLRDRPVRRHGDADAGSHARRDGRQPRHADEALPGPGRQGAGPDHGPAGQAHPAQPATSAKHGQRAQADDARRGEPAGRHRVRSARHPRPGLDIAGEDRYRPEREKQHRPERRGVHRIRTCFQPNHRYRRHH